LEASHGWPCLLLGETSENRSAVAWRSLRQAAGCPAAGYLLDISLAETSNHHDVGVSCALAQRDDLTIFRRVVPAFSVGDGGKFHEDGAHIRPCSGSHYVFGFNRNPTPLIRFQNGAHLFRVFIECSLIQNLFDRDYQICHSSECKSPHRSSPCLRGERG